MAITIDITKKRVFANPRSKRQKYYVYGSALNSVAGNSNTSSVGGGSGSTSSNEEYITQNGGVFRNGDYYFEEATLNFDKNNPINFVSEVEIKSDDTETEAEVLSSLVFNGTDTLNFSKLHLLPVTNGTYDIGSNLAKWRNLYGTYFSGNSETANKWFRPIDIKLTGSVTGTGSIDGSGDVTINTIGAGEGIYWGQTPVGNGVVFGALNYADGIFGTHYEVNGDPKYDIGKPTNRYRDIYAAKGYFGRYDFAGGTRTQGISIAGDNSSIYMYGSSDLNDRTKIWGPRISFNWQYTGNDDSKSCSIMQIGPKGLHIVERVYIGSGIGSGIYDERYNELINNNYNLFAATIGCDTLLEKSDRRLKSDIEEIEEVDLSKIHTYKYTIQNDDEEPVQKIGVMAQEVQEVYPELVKGKDNLAVNYNGLVALLIAEVNSLKKQVSFLQEEINGLKK